MLLFVDESGHHESGTPYEVLAGVAISEDNLWNLVPTEIWTDHNKERQWPTLADQPKQASICIKLTKVNGFDCRICALRPLPSVAPLGQ